MGNNQENRTRIIWFDANIKSNENQGYIKELKGNNDIKFESFDSIEKGIKSLQDIKFQNTIIITSGSLCPELCERLRELVDKIFFIPKVIIFTGDKQNYITTNNNHPNPVPINDPFYNSGGITDEIGEVRKFVENSTKQKEEELKMDADEKFKFQLITNKNDLILPMYYQEYVKKSTEKEIKAFNERILSENKIISPIESIFSQLTSSGNIPLNLLTKFWLRAYSSHSPFTKKMNEDLFNGEFQEYLPIIQTFYDVSNKGKLFPDNSVLYKGILASKNEWEPFYDQFNLANNNDLPKAILYGPSFFSFYKDEDIVKKFRKAHEGILASERFEIFVWMTLEKPCNLNFIKNQAIIDKRISYFNTDKEVLFFPFSCFEIKQMKKLNEKEYEIVLNYLDKYTEKFNDQETKTFEQVPETGYSKMIFQSKLIDANLINMPPFLNQSTEIESIKDIIEIFKKIDNEILQEAVLKVCRNVIIENFNDFQNLEDIIQKNLKKFINLNWYVKISKEQTNNYGNINKESLMIFKTRFPLDEYYINISLP